MEKAKNSKITSKVLCDHEQYMSIDKKTNINFRKLEILYTKLKSRKDPKSVTSKNGHKTRFGALNPNINIVGCCLQVARIVKTLIRSPPITTTTTTLLPTYKISGCFDT